MSNTFSTFEESFTNPLALSGPSSRSAACQLKSMTSPIWLTISIKRGNVLSLYGNRVLDNISNLIIYLALKRLANDYLFSVRTHFTELSHERWSYAPLKSEDMLNLNTYCLLQNHHRSFRYFFWMVTYVMTKTKTPDKRDISYQMWNVPGKKPLIEEHYDSFERRDIRIVIEKRNEICSIVSNLNSKV